MEEVHAEEIRWDCVLAGEEAAQPHCAEEGLWLELVSVVGEET